MLPPDDTDKTIIASRPYRVSAGQRLNGIFEIDSLIGLGGMSEIYRGHNIQTMDDVAIKVILPEFAADEQMVSLFRREALTLNRLNHETIVRYHVFSHDAALDLLYLAMEFVDGQTLRDYCKNRPLSREEACLLISKVAKGIAVAHGEGVVHRDLTTDNIILENNNVEKPKVIDFGIALANETKDSTIISSGFAGKYNFVSPEQVGLFEGKVGPPSDVYSLGLVFAATMQGRPLDMAGSHADVVRKRQVLPDISMINPDVKPILEMMLQPNPALRYQSMEDVSNALEAKFPFLIEKNPREARKLRESSPPGKKQIAHDNLVRRSFPFFRVALFLLAAVVLFAVLQMNIGKGVLERAVVSLTGNDSKTEKPGEATKKGKSEIKVELGSTKEDGAAKDSFSQDDIAALPAKPNDALLPNEETIIAKPTTPSSWVKEFNGGECFLARGAADINSSHRIEGFAKQVEPFKDLEQRYQSAFGKEPDIGLRLVKPEQCPVLEYVRRNKFDTGVVSITLQRDLLDKKQPFEAVITTSQNTKTGLFVITAGGTVANVTSQATRRPSAPDIRLEIPSQSFASKAGDGYLFLVITGDEKFRILDDVQTTKLVDFLDILAKAEGRVLATDVKYFRKR